MRFRTTSLVLLVVFVSALVSVSHVAQAAPKTLNFNVVPIRITNITADLNNVQFIAEGFIGQQPFTTPLALTGTCPILNLELEAIHLNLLGLVVDTSDICLDITAQAGGGLLGDLLCAVANLLNQGNSSGDILSTLSAEQLSLFMDGLTGVLTGVLTQVTTASAAVAASCDILNLELGPIDLTLLGLNVSLDDCAEGPVTVDITAMPGALLGNLLCGLAGILDNTTQAPVAPQARLLQKISTEISRLLQ